MRKLKLLMVAFMATVGLGVNAQNYEIDQTFTSVASLLDGQLFAIVNESEGNAIYNSGAQNLAYNTYDNAISGAAYLWKIHSLAGESDVNVQACYTVEAVNADGSSITIWGNRTPLLLNSGPSTGYNGCFVLDNGNQYGTDAQYHGIWEIEYVSGQGFTLKNKGCGGYFAGVSPRADGQTPVYWTFCTLKEKDPLEVAKNKYNSVKALVEALDDDVSVYTGSATLDISAAQTAFEAATTEAAIDAAIDKLYEAATLFITSVTVNEGKAFDLTNLWIVNPSFENNFEGWTNNGMATQSNDSFEKVGLLYAEAWQPNGTKSVSQTISTLPEGYYRLSATSKARGVTSAKIFANQGETAITVADETHTYSVNFAYYDGVTIGFEGVGTGAESSWLCVDNFQLSYVRALTTEEKTATYTAAITAANNLNGLIPTAAYNALQQTITDNTVTNGTAAEYNAAAAVINAAVENVTPLVAPYAVFNTLVDKANAIANVVYTETTSGSHTTFANAITAQTTAADNATSAADITAATNALIAAIKTYIAGAEPANDGEYFDITCLMVNPNFDDSHNGWTYLSAPGVNWSNCEYYEKEFDINQTVTGLPTGSYSLSVQAFQRPGWAGNVYNDYINGTDNASSVLYINSITSNVKNIAADAQVEGKLGPDGEGKWGGWPNDSQVGTEGNYKYVPNSQQGANLYFAAGLYDATCAAVVDDAANGSLKLGFKSTKTHVDGDWTIFDNFRLYYYGSSKMIYYKQYLPQLEAEVAANYLNNAAYAVLKDGQSERTALATANSADAATLNTETDLETAINDITAARDAFILAKTAYDNLAIGLASSTFNVGDGVFQMSSSQKDTFEGAVATGTTMYNTGTASLAEVTAQILAISNAYVLNEPDASKRYNLVVATASHPKKDNAIVIVPGTTGENNPTGYGLNANFAINSNLNQGVTFTKVSGNKYNISFETAAGTTYLTYGVTNGSAAGHKNYQIQATTDASKKGEFLIVATNTDKVFNIYNTITNSTIACQDVGNIYTEAGNADFTVAEASEASITINTTEAKWGTTILPFAVASASLPDGVKAYTCADKTNDTELTLVEATSIAANTPYIIEGSWNETLTGWGLGATTTYTEGWLTGVYKATAAPVGSYVLQKNSEGVGFYKVADSKQPTVGANRCYLTVSDAARAFFLLGGEANAIKAIETLTSGEAEIYNAAGARVPGLQKGMNIIRKADGQSYKVMVK